MFWAKNSTKKEKAEKIIEISLPVLLIVFTIVSMYIFSDNLLQVADNIYQNGLFNNKSTNLANNKNVNQYIKQSQVIVNKYKRTLAITDEQKEELAKAATIAKLTGQLSSDDENFVLLTYGINVNTLTYTTYINDDKKLSYNERELYLEKDKNKISAINEILVGKFS